MTESRPIDVTRKDGVLVPKQRWLFDRLFAEGQEYTIEIHEPRSTKSHAHFFAVVREAWKNLPEQYGIQHPDPEHLRKFALIKCGYSIKRNVVCETVEMAHQVAAMAGQLDESAVIVVQGTVVTIATARSQKTTGPQAMDRDEFQKSKSDIIDYVASLIGVDPATLSSQITNSSDAQQDPPSRDRMDTPAANGPHSIKAAGVSYSFKEPGWIDHYIGFLIEVRDDPASMKTRHQTAIRSASDEPLNQVQHQIMTSAVRLVKARNEAALRKGEWDERMADLRQQAEASIRPETKGAAA